jgi:photosystem II stability/assembly factor-like uncharacterized protein
MMFPTSVPVLASSVCLIAALAAIPCRADAAWSSANSPNGKWVGGAVDGADLYAFEPQDHVYRSSDRGFSWQDISANTAGALQGCLAVKGGEAFLGALNGIYRRAGDGQAWTRVNTGLEDTTVQTLAFAAGGVLAGTGKNGHLYRSLDHGAHWTRLNASAEMGAVLAFAVDGAHIYAGTSKGVWHSPDDGATWTASQPSPDDPAAYGVVVKGRFLFARGRDNLYRSPDSGKTWNKLNPGTTTALPRFRSLDLIGSVLFATSPIDGLFRSGDDGDHWNRDTSFFYRYRQPGAFNILPLGSELFAATSYGIYRSADQGASWEAVNRGIASGTLDPLLRLPSGRLLAPVSNGMFSSPDLGTHWAPEPFDPYRVSSSMYVMGRYLHTGVYHTGIFRSTDGGATWESSPGEWSDQAFGRFQHFGSDLYVGNGNHRGILHSSDSGATWKQQGVDDGAVTYDLARIPAGLFAATDTGLYRFDANRNAWGYFPSSLGHTWVLELAVQGSALLAGTFSSGIWRSTDGGATWTQALDTAKARNIREILIAGGNAYAATDSGVFLSRDQGASWDPLNSGLPSDRAVQSLLLAGDTLVAGVYGQGIWKLHADGLPSAGRAWSRAAGPTALPAAHFPGRGKVGFSRPGSGQHRRYDAVGKATR